MESKFLNGTVSRILVPVDFSSRSSLALEHAVEVARIYGAAIWLLHVLDSTAFVAGSVPGVLVDMYARCETAMEELAGPARSQGIECTTLIREGEVVGQIQQLIADHQMDMLVLTTKAGTGMAGFALTSTAEHILRQTDIPVLTVSDCRPVRKWSGEDRCFHIFYATDLSAESLRSLEYARALQHRLCVEFTIAHGVPRHAGSERIGAVSRQLRALAEGTSSKIEILHEAVGPAICAAAARAKADVIAIGVKKHSFLREMLLGHTLLEILYGAPCPVLTFQLSSVVNS
jgi:nucleotide-binding universal stress UspA family protein